MKMPKIKSSPGTRLALMTLGAGLLAVPAFAEECVWVEARSIECANGAFVPAQGLWTCCDHGGYANCICMGWDIDRGYYDCGFANGCFS